MMGTSENIIVSERIRGVLGEHEDRYEIAGDNREVCESKRRLKAKESRTDEIIWRLWKRGTQVRKAQVEKECVVTIRRESSRPLPMKTLQKERAR